MQRFSVSDVAYILNMTPGALRFYEQAGVIQTKKTESGRRYYDYADISWLLSFKKYTSMEIPLKTIQKQFNFTRGDSRSEIYERLREKERSLREKAEYYRHLAGWVQEQADLLETIDAVCGRYTIVQREEAYALYDPEDYLISRQPETRRTIREWVKGMPATKVALILEKGAASPVYGYTVTAKNAELLRLRTQGCNIRHLPACPCVQIIAAIESGFSYPDTVFGGALAFLREKGFEVAGEALATIAVAESLPDIPYLGYMDISIPILL